MHTKINSKSPNPEPATIMIQPSAKLFNINNGYPPFLLTIFSEKQRKSTKATMLNTGCG